MAIQDLSKERANKYWEWTTVASATETRSERKSSELKRHTNPVPAPEEGVSGY